MSDSSSGGEDEDSNSMELNHSFGDEGDAEHGTRTLINHVGENEHEDDSDEDNLDSETQGSSNVCFTGFLFGNVDTKTGKLEDPSIFGSDSDKQIRGLESLGYGFTSVLSPGQNNGVQRNHHNSSKLSDESSNSSDSDDEISLKKAHVPRSNNIDSSEVKKLPDAIDYSDIREEIEELEISGELSSSCTDEDDYDSYDTDILTKENDSIKMPPPPIPKPKESQHSKAIELLPCSSGSSSEPVPSTSAPASSSTSATTTTTTSPTAPVPPERKLETPLAAMLPSKYAGVSVTTLFPDFRPDRVLRFSRLFGHGKYSSLPHVWRTAKKRRKKLKEKQAEQNSSSGEPQPSVSVVGFPDLPPLPLPSTPSFPLIDDYDSSEFFNYEEIENPDPSMCLPDQEEIFCRPAEQSSKGENNKEKNCDPAKLQKQLKTSLWRHGPAEMWYDAYQVPDEPESFDYGFKLKKNEKQDSDSDDNQSSDEESKQKKPEPIFPPESFLMVTQSEWEDNIIWDKDDPRVRQKLNKSKTAGWVPCGSNRSVQNIGKQEVMLNPNLSPVKIGTSQTTPNTSTSKKQGSGSKVTDEPVQQDDTWYSIFPVETPELVKGHWERDIIWDHENVSYIPEPKVLELDPNDENIILCIPEDIDPNASQNTSAPVKVKIPHPHVKKSKILLGKAGVINVIEEDSPPPSPKHDDKDPYNISLDEYYQPKHTEQALIKISTSGNIIQHSTPVIELKAPFIPTHMNVQKLRSFHRPPLRKFNNGPLAPPGPHSLLPLTRHIQKKAKAREAERLAAGGGDIFFMRTPEDFSGKDGELLLIEYCEEHPPLLNQVGMCSKLKNYYKRKGGTDDGPTDCKYGETVHAHTSPFLGAMHPGQMIQTIENNMYRSAIFLHAVKMYDFLVIRTRNYFYIRTFDAIFTAAQECPLYEVPGPNSKRANNFVRDFLQVFIYRLFRNSQDNPKRIRMDDIKRAFPCHSESSIRKRLKLCADFKRTGSDSNWWVIKPEFRLPSEEEIRAMVSPEQCCAYFSLVSSEQRLKDAGYGTQSILAPLPEEDDENDEKKLDDEVKVAPWNTTRAYIQAIKGKCILQINGPADPTGCGEGFSYVRMPNKPQTTVEEKDSQPKRIVTGTDADLRRLSLNNAKALLRKFQVPEEEIQKLSRWEVIDVVRTLSTEKAKAGEEGISKFSRGNRFSVAEHQERYKEECQRIFELQNRVLQSSEVLSTDEGESTEEEDDIEDIEEMGKNIEKMLSNKKTSSQLTHEKEEAERRELQRMIMGEGKDDKEEDKTPKKKRREIEDDDRTLHGLSLHPGRVLKIYRKFREPNGTEYTREEIIRKPHVIDIYMRIRTTKDEQFIRQFALIDDQTKEEMKKEKRRIQEQLRRIKKNQEREQAIKPPPQRKKKVKMKPELKMKCGACQQVGHMRTNKACPLYDKTNDIMPSMNVAMTEEEETEIEKELITDDDGSIVKVDGTKLHVSSKVFKQVEDMKRQSLKIKVPKEAIATPKKIKKKRNTNSEPHCDYLEGKSKTINRQRIDPKVVFSNILEEVIGEMRNDPDSGSFLHPVSNKIPRYYEMIRKPMDLQTIREKNRLKSYTTREQFLQDVKLMWDNALLYNGENNILTLSAERLYEIAVQKLQQHDSKLSKLEKQINPLLDENDKKRLAYILNKVIDKVKVIPEALVFLKPVNKKQEKNYYDVIQTPMDLETMTKKINQGRYSSRYDFLADFQQIHSNASLYNGAEHTVTNRALLIMDSARTALKEYEATLEELEANIKRNEKHEGHEEDHHMNSMDESKFDNESTSYSHNSDHEDSSHFGMNDSTNYSEDDESITQSRKRPRFQSYEYETDMSWHNRPTSESESQAEAIEAMLDLSKNSLPSTSFGHYSGTVHDDLEVSDSNDEEEDGEIRDDDDDD